MPAVFTSQPAFHFLTTLVKMKSVMSNPIPLERSFFEKDTIWVARNLLGKYLVRRTDRGKMCGKIVETEAYLGVSDPACHAYAGLTPRTAIFFGKPGVAYVFVIFGIHYCLNVITLPEPLAGCVLIRALEPVFGLDLMRKNRPVDRDIDLTNGPGKLTKALSIDSTHNGLDLTKPDEELIITGGYDEFFEIEVTERVGISKAADELLRFYIKNNPFVSYPRYPRNKKIS